MLTYYKQNHAEVTVQIFFFNLHSNFIFATFDSLNFGKNVAKLSFCSTQRINVNVFLVILHSKSIWNTLEKKYSACFLFAHYLLTVLLFNLVCWQRICFCSYLITTTTTIYVSFPFLNLCFSPYCAADVFFLFIVWYTKWCV